jgi:hypothetical protein
MISSSIAAGRSAYESPGCGGRPRRIEGDLQMSPQYSGLRRLVFRKRSHLPISLEHARNRPERYACGVVGRIPPATSRVTGAALWCGGPPLLSIAYP